MHTVYQVCVCFQRPIRYALFQQRMDRLMRWLPLRRCGPLEVLNGVL